MLRDHLPAFLVAHPQMYGLLSSGLHELTEEACLENFDMLKIATELVLDERIEKQEREAKIEKATKFLSAKVEQS